MAAALAVHCFPAALCVRPLASISRWINVHLYRPFSAALSVGVILPAAISGQVLALRVLSFHCFRPRSAMSVQEMTGQSCGASQPAASCLSTTRLGKLRSASQPAARPDDGARLRSMQKPSLFRDGCMAMDTILGAVACTADDHDQRQAWLWYLVGDKIVLARLSQTCSFLRHAAHFQCLHCPRSFHFVQNLSLIHI